MRGRTPLLVLLVSGLTFLASLYLPWQVSASTSCGSNCVFKGSSVDAWSSGVGDAAAVITVALAAATIAVVVRPGLAQRLPLGAGGLLTAYFGVAIAALFRARSGLAALTPVHPHFHWAYGAYIGVASGVITGIAAATFRRDELPRRPILSVALGRLLGLGLLVSFLLPWFRATLGSPPVTYSELGLLSPAAVLAAVAVGFGATREAGRRILLVAATLFTLGAFSTSSPVVPRAYGAWLGLGFALALFVVVVVPARASWRVAWPTVDNGLPAGAAAVFIASLFFRWQHECLPGSAGAHPLGPQLGLCTSANGWSLPNSAGAALAFVLVVSLLVRPLAAVTELSIGIALCAATTGFQFGDSDSAFQNHFAYGAFIGFAAAGILLAVALARLDLPPLDRRRLAVRIVPLAASLACVAAVALAWWSVLPGSWQEETAVLVGWLAATGLLLSLHLLRLWLRSVQSPVGGHALTFTPLALLTLVALALVVERRQELTWGAGTLVALCLLLAALGWIEERNGLESAHVSEAWRLDRLPDAES
jgi:hypothetical protein